MGFRFLPSGYVRQFRTDVRTLFFRRIRNGPSIADRALALDRIAGSLFLVCIAGWVVWLAGQMLPAGLPRVHIVSESAQAASPGLELQKAGGEPSGESMSADDIRKLQNWLMMAGFDPGPIDGIAGPRTLSAFNEYRASKNLSRVPQIDRSNAAELLN